MKKSKLIELLNALPGDPDIKIWNGLVQDWMDIEKEIPQSILVKETLAHWLESCRLEECVERKDWNHQLSEKTVTELKSNYERLHPWEFNEYVTPEDIEKKNYKMKKIYLLQPKVRGVKTWDRQGDLSY